MLISANTIIMPFDTDKMCKKILNQKYLYLHSLAMTISDKCNLKKKI